MALRLVADRIEDLPETLRSAAVDQQGKLWVNDLGHHSVEDARTLKEGLVAERTARKKAEGMLKQFGWHLSEDGARWTAEGMSPEGARDAFEKARTGAGKQDADNERWKKAIQDKFDADRRKMDEGLGKLKERLRQAMVVDPIRAAIREHGGSVQLLAPVVERAAKVDIDDDFNVAVALLNDKGQVQLTKKSGSTDPMGFDEFVQDLRKHPDYRAAFAGNGTGGSGFASQSGGSTRVVHRGGDVTQMNPRETLRRAFERTA